MGATSQAEARRKQEGYYQKYFKGVGIDIGCGDDPLVPEAGSQVTQWDILDGDAQVMAGVDAESFDFVYSSHCLEHMREPLVAVQRWWELVAPGGYLIVVVPDEDLYEQCLWPSRFNTDHKSTWTIHKAAGTSWSPVSNNVSDVFSSLPGSQIVSVRLYDTGYDYSLHKAVVASIIVSREQALHIEKHDMMVFPEDALDNTPRCLGFYPVDQTSRGAEIGIEVIARKVC